MRPPDPAPTFESTAGQSQPALEPRALLLVDDEPQICAALKRILHHEGYRIHVANAPDEAFEILAHHPVEVIVCDQRMPNALGTEFLSHVQERYPDTVRMILSGGADVEDVASAMSAGVIYKFLTKPIEPSLLRANIREAFQRAASARSSETRTARSFDRTIGLPTREYVKLVFEELTNAAEQDGSSICMLMLKLDQHQSVVSSFGLAFGSRFLRAVAQRLTSGLSGQFLLCHEAPGTFIVLASDHHPAQRIDGMDLEIDRIFAAPVQVDGKSIAVTVSVGATAARPPVTCDQMFDQVHAAMMAGSDRGGGTMEIYQPHLVAAFRGQLELESDLRQALSASAFDIHYQPQVEIASGRIVGVEALLRWRHPKRGFVSPAEFVPLAERLGLIVELGDWVLGSAIARLAEWRRDGHAPEELAINVSPLQLKNTSFMNRVREVLEHHAVPPHEMVLELTESAAVEGGSALAGTLQALGELGVTVAIDDFGTGYANLANLTQLAINKVKIDRSLLPREHDERGSRLFATIIGIARELGLATVAEGVETERELAAVRAAGCTTVQGYLYSRPVTAEELIVLLRRGFPPIEC